MSMYVIVAYCIYCGIRMYPMYLWCGSNCTQHLWISVNSRASFQLKEAKQIQKDVTKESLGIVFISAQLKSSAA